jgi:formate dehydrogenase assembly factor FdhD
MRADDVTGTQQADAPLAEAESQLAVRQVRRDGMRDSVAVEEPLEIRVDGEPVAVTMRTPAWPRRAIPGTPSSPSATA